MGTKKKVKLDIYGGMLGTGKTTLIRQMLATAYKNKKVVIIENEIGTVNLDEEAFENPSIEVKALTGGCVCCTVKGTFTDAVKVLIDQEMPDYIIVEPSGVADFTTVADACMNVNGVELNRAILLINGRKFLSLIQIAGEFLFAQIRSANTVFLNFSAMLKPDVLDQIKKKLWEINSELFIIDLPMEEVDETVIPDGLGELDTFPGIMFSKRGRTRETKSWTYALNVPLDDQYKEALTRIFSFYPENGLWRGKGYFDRPDGSILKIDYVYGDVFEKTVDDYPVEKRNLLVAIGESNSIGKHELDQLLAHETDQRACKKISINKKRKI